jgi:putative membrane-bound dehydrogenase-like protein
MKRLVPAILIAAGCAGGDAPGKATAPDLQVGFAAVDITPDYPTRLSGYESRREENDGVAQRIHARAMAIGAHEPALIVNLENCGIPAGAAEFVAERAGVPRERLVLCATHTHSAPALATYAPWIIREPYPDDQRGRIERYTRELIDKLAAVAQEALRRRVPARLAWAQGRAGFAANRRVLKNGRWTGFGVQPDGPTDPSLPILKATGADGKLLGVVANYACHCTTLGGDFMKIGGDWAGTAQELLEQEHPGATAMVLIGCGADANPEPRGKLEQARQHGRAVADEVKRLLAGPAAPIESAPATRLERIPLPFGEPPPREEWERRAKQSGAAALQARAVLARLDAGEKLPTHLDYPVAIWTFGDELAMVFLAGEVVVDYALRLKRETDPERLWITAYANEIPCYIPSKRVLAEGGYEADASMIYYDRPTRFAPEVEDRIIETVWKHLPAAFRWTRPRSPEASLASIRVAPEFVVELVAAEPLLEDPVAFDWGPDGRLWVAEMRDYPLGMDGRYAPGGRVRVLEDTDGDGRYDKTSLFLDGLPMCKGVKVWRKGVLVTAAPDILYAEDTDGDGRADKVEKLYSGLSPGNPQHRANGLRWRLDGWLQVANGDSGGTVVSARTGQKVQIRGRDLRIQPDTGGIDAQSGQTQFGTDPDDWGNWFGCNNPNPIWHYVLADEYLRRNPHVAPPDPKRMMVGSEPVYPLSRTLERFNDYWMRNLFTSACGLTIYRDELLGAAFAGNSFTCEPVHNLVSRRVLTPDGVTFRAARAPEEQDREFLASSDNWSRFVMARTGPDGALWIADMYRYVIEHPEWIPKDWQARLDLRAGDTLGRIYRVSRKDAPPRPFPRLDRLDTRGLVAALDTPNGWVRDTVHELLLWNADPSAAGPLEETASTCPRPQARLQALCALDGLGALKSETLRRALKDEHPGVRRGAVRLCESRLESDEALRAAIVAMAEDPDPQVRLQLACTLGQTKDPRAADALWEVLQAGQDDPYVAAAALSSALPHLETLTAYAIDRGSSELQGRLISIAVRVHDAKALGGYLRAATDPDGPNRLDLTGTLLETLSRGGGSSEKLRADLKDEPELLDRLDAAIEQARSVVNDENADAKLRVSSMRLLGHEPERREADLKTLTNLLRPIQPLEVQLGAVGALSRLRPKETPALLLENWGSRGPAVRGAILDQLLSRNEWTQALLKAMESAPDLAASLDATRRAALLRHENAAIRKRAEKILGAPTTSDVQPIIDGLAKEMAGLTGKPAEGRAVFEARCSKCHRVGDVGTQVGAELAAFAGRSPDALLVAIVDPNRAVEDRYMEYRAITRDERMVIGMIASETGTAITLRGPEGKDETILRTDLKELTASRRSMMPEGLEKGLTAQQTADLIAFITSARPRREFPGNLPETVRAGEDGSLALPASKASIYGGNIAFELKHRNIGFWDGPDDYVSWAIEVPRAGAYAVELEWACRDNASGNTFRIAAGGAELSGVVPGTGMWDDYETRGFGRIQLKEGPQPLVVRPGEGLKGPLMDLRTVRLVPER